MKKLKKALKERADNVHKNKIIHFIADRGELTMQNDGLYAEIFAVKDGVRYDSHIVNIDDASKILIDCLVDGIQNIIMGEVEESNIDYD